MAKNMSSAMTLVTVAPVAKMKINEDVLKQFVGNLIVAHNLKLKGWISDVLQSDVLEHKIYEFAVRQAMEYCYYEVRIAFFLLQKELLDSLIYTKNSN